MADANFQVKKGLTVPKGSQSEPSIIFTAADSDTGIYSPAEDQVSVATAGSEVVRVNSSGQIQAVGSGSAAVPIYTFAEDNDTGVFSPGNNELSVVAGSSEVLKVNSSGQIQAVGSGSAAVPIYTFAEDSDTGVFSPGDNKLAVVTSGTERVEFGTSEVVFNDGGKNYDFRIEGDTNSSLFFVDASADAVGIGTASPAALLELEKNGETELRLTRTNAVSNYCKISAAGSNSEQLTIETDPVGSGAGYINFRNNNSDAMRIDSSGRLLVGTSSARANFFNSTISAGIQLEGAGTVPSQRFLSVVNNYATDGDGGGYFVLARSKGGTVGSTTVVASGDQLGAIGFQGSDGTQFVLGARIEGYVDGTPGANDMPGRLVFSTTANGASSSTERMRLDKNGAMLLGTQTINGQAGLTLRPNITEGAAQLVFNRASTTNTSFCNLFKNGGTNVGSISYTNTATAFNTSSDYRLKENVVPLTGAVDRLNQLQVYRFNFIADPDKTVDGFIAHEAQAVVPECVTGTKDDVDDEGNPVYQGIDQSKLVPLVVAALQEELAEIETLKSRLAAAGIS